MQPYRKLRKVQLIEFTSGHKVTLLYICFAIMTQWAYMDVNCYAQHYMYLH